jgi:hypothetical protein
MMDPESSDADESRDGTISPKRQKLSTPQVVETALNGRNGQPERPPSEISGDDERDGLGNLSDDGSISSGSIPTPSTLDSTLQASRERWHRFS